MKILDSTNNWEKGTSTLSIDQATNREIQQQLMELFPVIGDLKGDNLFDI